MRSGDHTGNARRVERRFAVAEISGILLHDGITPGVQSSTSSQGRYLLSFSGLDAIRNRIAQARPTGSAPVVAGTAQLELPGITSEEINAYVQDHEISAQKVPEFTAQLELFVGSGAVGAGQGPSATAETAGRVSRGRRGPSPAEVGLAADTVELMKVSPRKYKPSERDLREVEAYARAMLTKLKPRRGMVKQSAAKPSGVVKPQAHEAGPANS